MARLWIAFAVHDLGYWGKPNMDGPEGERHVLWGATLMRRLFGPEWGAFCLYHSRHWAKRDGRPYSLLCVADKLATALEPWWLYLPRVMASGELWEFMAAAGNREAAYPALFLLVGKRRELRVDEHRVRHRIDAQIARAAGGIGHQGREG